MQHDHVPKKFNFGLGHPPQSQVHPGDQTQACKLKACLIEKNRMSCVITVSAPTNDHAQIRFCTFHIYGFAYNEMLSDIIALEKCEVH